MDKRLMILFVALLCNARALELEDGKETDVGEEQIGNEQMQEIVLEEEQPPKKVVEESHLRNWLFAGGSLIVATIGVIIVGWSQGEAP